MEAFAVVIGLAVLLWLVVMPAAALIIAGVSMGEVRQLRLRIANLERRVRAGQVSSEPVPSEPVPQPTVAARPTPPRRATPRPPRPPAPRPEPSRPEPSRPEPSRPEPSRPKPSHPKPASLSTERVAVWVASAVGGLLVILASLLALAVAVDRGWLGPAARVCLGLIAGTGAWLGGAALRRGGHRLVSSALAGAGLGVIYGTLWATHALYDFLPRPPTVALMIATTGVALLCAVRWRDRFMAHLGLVGGLLTPVLLSTGNNEPLALFSYLALLAAGALAAASRRGWPDLVVTAAVGCVGLSATWVGAWWQPDQVPFGLVAPIVLAVPFAVAAARRSTADSVAWLATAAAVLLPALTLPWVAPIDPLFYDPRTGEQVLRDLGSAPWYVAAVLPVIALPAQLVALRRGWWPVGAAASLVGGGIAVIAAISWAGHYTPSPLPIALMTLGPLALGALLYGPGSDGPGSDAPGRGGAPLAALAGLAAVGVLLAADQPLAGTAAVLSALAALGVVGALRTRESAWLVGSFLAMAAATGTAATLIDALGPRAVGAPALLAFALFVPLPALARRFRGQEVVPVLAGALAGPALFLPLYIAWEAAWTDAVIGLLPLLLASIALLTAVLLFRARRVGRGDLVLALFVGVALLGLSAALPLQLERQWLTIAWAIEGAALALLSRRLTHPLIRVASVALGVAVAIRLLGNPWALEYGDAGGLPILNWTLYTWGLPALCLAAQARWLTPTAEERARVPAFVPPMLRVLAILVGFALVHVEVSHLFSESGSLELGGHGVLQGMVHSLSWAAYGVAVLSGGLVLQMRHVRLVGFALVLVATGKVFAVDLWSLSGFVRVGSVLGLGVTLLLSAFLFERLVLRSDSEDSDPGSDPDSDPDSDSLPSLDRAPDAEAS